MGTIHWDHHLNSFVYECKIGNIREQQGILRAEDDPSGIFFTTDNLLFRNFPD
jgi:hypothetical protein